MTSLLRNIFPKFTCMLKSRTVPKKLLPNITPLNFFSNVPSPTPYEIVDQNEKNSERELIKSDIIRKITEKVQNEGEPLFAVVHVAGKQFKITRGDIIVIEGYWPPDAGDKISLDKVMIVGAKDFSIIGKPLIQNGLVRVDATVIEKTVSHTKTHFKKKRRKQYKRINFYRIPQTKLQINTIRFVGEINNPPDVSEVKTRSIK
ncbi:hypothetical protein HHI36_010379 [Cryptolaemus montrouzieri]|uniref:Large ribosomal subunit protein bL21m n=1 Tax=Cryptolaemus montrouzieri TaxID=559131 RepID=A0ABD2MII7_9CUCU